MASYSRSRPIVFDMNRLERNSVQVLGRRNAQPLKDRWSKVPHGT
jgi:hypothetical protein